jgi:hypothetical protein
MEEGETELQTAFRELQEETGIRSEDVILDPKFRFEHSYMLPRRIAKGYGALNVRKDLVVFMATIRSASVMTRIRTTEEHPLGYMWHTWRPPHNIQQYASSALSLCFSFGISTRLVLYAIVCVASPCDRRQTIDPLLKAVADHYAVLEGPVPYSPPSFVS